MSTDNTQRHCPDCHVIVEGLWQRCPVCSAEVEGTQPVTPEIFAVVPLKFSRRIILRALLAVSLILVAFSLIAQYFLGNTPAGQFGVFRYVWLAIATVWLMTTIAVQQRRNIAKAASYLLVVVALLSLYWDYLTGWHGWAVTFVIPIVSASVIVGIMLTVWLMRTEVGDYVLYSGLTVVLGLMSLVFLFFDIVSTPYPAVICGGIAFIALIYLRITRGTAIRHELSKRLHL